MHYTAYTQIYAVVWGKKNASMVGGTLSEYQAHYFVVMIKYTSSSLINTPYKGACGVIFAYPIVN